MTVTEAELRALALTNYGHFTTFRVEDGGVRGLSLHLERLARDCRALFGTTLDLDAVRAQVRREVAGAAPVTVRVTVFDPALDIGRPVRAGQPRVLVTRRAAGPAPGPLRVRTVAFERDAPEIKSVGLFPVLRLRRAAQIDGYDDALFVDRDGLISEGGTWNVGFIRSDRVVWPAAAYLRGVTMQLLPGESIAVRRDDLSQFDAAFATNAATGVRAVAAVDDVTYDVGHPSITALAAAYLRLAPEVL
ncbi:aminotransferase class IV [Symbioplanes lichenis]|uniref:aminotransferase class IV n=1 Tax=Symbioplanes lichenis TaxID=1629072 RepID=UPI00273A1376|nr:aminotransferase class IV [Actinoplanes lichenis]